MMTTDPYQLLPSRAMSRRVHHRASPQSYAVSAASRLIVKNTVRAWAMQPNLRWPLEYVDGFAGLLPRFGSTAHVAPVRLDNCAAEWVRAPGASAARAILYFHGGAFLTCGLNTHRSMVIRLSKAADAAVLTVCYRKLPSHQITDAIEDGLSGLRWLQELGYDGDQLVVAGDSAGGYLAFMTTLAAIRSHDLTRPGSRRFRRSPTRIPPESSSTATHESAPCSRGAPCRGSPNSSARSTCRVTSRVGRRGRLTGGGRPFAHAAGNHPRQLRRVADAGRRVDGRAARGERSPLRSAPLGQADPRFPARRPTCSPKGGGRSATSATSSSRSPPRPAASRRAGSPPRRAGRAYGNACAAGFSAGRPSRTPLPWERTAIRQADPAPNWRSGRYSGSS